MELQFSDVQSQAKSVPLPRDVEFADYHVKIREIISYWRSIHPAQGLPGRQHFDPVDIPRLLPNLRLVDVEGNPPRFKTRLMGTVLVDFFGQEHTGCYFDDLYPKFAETATYIDMMDVVTSKQPNYRFGAPGLVYEKEFATVERIYLPMATDGVLVDLILTCILFGDEDGSIN